MSPVTKEIIEYIYTCNYFRKVSSFPSVIISDKCEYDYQVLGPQ
jgi:hypothetical protein